jgi:hypothetical protein
MEWLLTSDEAAPIFLMIGVVCLAFWLTWYIGTRR